jgi:hypothetical protein
MKRLKKCECGEVLCPPGGRPSHFWHLPEGLVELCASCSDRRALLYGEPRLPDVRFDFCLVPHGYQLDVYHDLRARGESRLEHVSVQCRDFSGNHSLRSLRDALTRALLAQVDRWRDEPTRGAGKGGPTITRVHVNQHVIRSNQKTGAREPPLTVKRGRSNTRAREVALAGPARVVYRPDDPLPCGARVWIETAHPVEIVDEKSKK